MKNNYVTSLKSLILWMALFIVSVSTYGQNNLTLTPDCGNSVLRITGSLAANNRVNIHIVKDGVIIAQIGEVSGSSINQTTPIQGAGSYYVRALEVNNDGNNIVSPTVSVNCTGGTTNPPTDPNPNPNPTCSVSSPNGAFDGADCTNLGGWALDQSDFNKTVTVDIYVDGNKVASVQANGDRQDLVGAFGNQAARYHGFSYQFPANASWKNGQNHNVTARICGVSYDIGGSPKAVNGCTGGGNNPDPNPNPNPTCSVSNPQGSFDAANCDGVYGWAFDQSDYGKTLTMDVYVDGNKVGSVQANGDRQDLVGAFGNQAARYHGFSYQFPANASWKNGQNHNVTARICGVSYDIGGSPKVVSGCTGGTTNPPTGGGGNGNGLAGNYYNNKDLSGNPTLSRTDATINFTWNEGGSPFPGVSATNMSARWEGQVEAPASGDYTFSTNNDDATRLWVNGQQLINDWPGGHAPELRSGTINLQAGQKYSIKLEFNQGGGGAQAQLLWSYPGQGQQLIPQGRLYSSGTTTNPPTGPGRLSAGGVGRILQPGDPNLESNWDWTVPTYKLWYNTGTIISQTPTNPFLFASSGRLYRDMYNADGWVLVAKDFGTSTAAIRLPFYILYNKYRGVLRAVIYYPDDQNAVTHHSVSLSFANNITTHPALFNFAEKSPDKSYLNNFDPSAKQTVITDASPGSFMIADFNVVGYDPSLFDPNSHIYDDLAFNIDVYHLNVTDVNEYSKLTLNGTVQPSSLGPLSDNVGTISNYFTKTLSKVGDIIETPGFSNVFEFIEGTNNLINGLFGGGGGYNVTLKGDINTQGTLTTPVYDGTINIYVKPKAQNNSPNYSPVNYIKWGLLNVNQFAPVTVHKNFVDGECYNLNGQKVQCAQYSANGFGIEPIINPDLELHIQGAYASYFGDQKFHLINANGPCPTNNPFGPQQVSPFRCNRYTNTRSYQSITNTDDVFSTVGVLFVFYHYGYGIPTNGGDDPNPVVVYKEFRLNRNFVDGGRLKAQDKEVTGLLPYPNPFEQEINIPVQLNDYSEGYDLEIVSIEGKRVWSTSGTLLAPTVVKWSGKEYSNLQAIPGIYLCKVSQKGIVISTYKIIMSK